jgi:hypothetical protein
MRDLLAALLEAGKRHSGRDERMLQDIHDAAIGLGAACGTKESAPQVYAAGLLEALGMSHGDLANLLRTALQSEAPAQNGYTWVRDVYDDHLVYEVTPKNEDGPPSLFQRSYSILDGAVTFGDPVEVVAVTDYVPVGEADRVEEAASGVAAWMRKHGGAHPFSACMGKFHDAQLCAKAKDIMTGTTKWRGASKESATEELTGGLVPLTEKAVKADGTVSLKIIAPGQGSSGYYPADVLKRDGPKVFTKGLHMHLDHPSVSEEADRPERSIATLAGTLTSDARWEANGAAGPGLYADARVRSDLAPIIEELAPHIGVSIRALGKAGTQEIGGKRVRTIEGITQAKSVDFVTVPGAGGKVLDLVESARQRHTGGGTPPPEDDGMEEKLNEANAKIADLETRLNEAERREREARLLQEARTLVVAKLAEAALPQPSRDRLVGQLAANPPTKDGALDADALATAVKEAADAEAAYLASVTGTAYRVTGMGGGPADPPAVPTLEESDKRIAEALKFL